MYQGTAAQKAQGLYGINISFWNNNITVHATRIFNILTTFV